MEIQTVADIKMIGRAFREDWPTSIDRKEEAVTALMNVFALRDPQLTIAAFEAFIKADTANIKRAELEAKEKERDDKRRLRILEFLKSLGPDEVGRLASESGFDISGTGVE